MSYCDDCSLLDICGKEGCCDKAMTFCADKNKFIHVSILDKIKRDIFNACSDNYHMPVYKLNCDEIFEIIDKYGKEQTDV